MRMRMPEPRVVGQATASVFLPCLFRLRHGRGSSYRQEKAMLRFGTKVEEAKRSSKKKANVTVAPVESL